MNDPARAATLLAIFLTTFTLTFREMFVYLLDLQRVNTFWYVLGSFLLFWVLAFRLELAAAEIEAELWECRKRQRRQPRPALFQSVNAMGDAHTLRRLNEGLTPLDAAHYAAIYHRLACKPEGKRWTITRSDLDVKWGGQPAFHNLTKIYRYPSKLGKHWHDLEWIDGYVRGDPNNEVWVLNEIGRAAFAKNAGNHLRLTSPTE